MNLVRFFEYLQSCRQVLKNLILFDFSLNMASSYEVPSWAGKPPSGLHLDIYKDDKFVQKIMIDEKKVNINYFKVFFTVILTFSSVR